MQEAANKQKCITLKTLHEMTLDGDFLEPENVDVLVVLNSIVSFHRSRRL